ncbi:UDP-N-acetylglucosamine-peptide N-acetylglucosaminyltransferase, partial [Duganella sp. FT50W]|nr:UDP-N-acetylglucosamine-peptide N-acetylglucosaminyltransferase [Duganella lactea]
SLAGVLLASEHGAGDLCQPAGLLLRRRQLGASFGHYQGQRYRQLAGVATALAALADGECAYLSAALSSYLPAATTPPTGALPAELEVALERLQLLCESNTQRDFLTDAPRFKQLLAGRLETLATLLRAHHLLLANGDAQVRQRVEQTLQRGYQLLLAPA